MGLTAEEIARWNADGYVIVRNALGPEDLAPLIADYEAIVENMARELLAAGRIKDGHAGLGFDRRFAAICAEDPTVSTGHLDEVKPGRDSQGWPSMREVWLRIPNRVT
jgi:hypothetical protein